MKLLLFFFWDAHCVRAPVVGGGRRSLITALVEVCRERGLPSSWVRANELLSELAGAGAAPRDARSKAEAWRCTRAPASLTAGSFVELWSLSSFAFRRPATGLFSRHDAAAASDRICRNSGERRLPPGRRGEAAFHRLRPRRAAGPSRRTRGAAAPPHCLPPGRRGEAPRLFIGSVRGSRTRRRPRETYGRSDRDVATPRDGATPGPRGRREEPAATSSRTGGPTTRT